MRFLESTSVADSFERIERARKTGDAGIQLSPAHNMLSILHSDPCWPVLIEKTGLADEKFREQFPG